MLILRVYLNAFVVVARERRQLTELLLELRFTESNRFFKVVDLVFLFEGLLFSLVPSELHQVLLEQLADVGLVADAYTTLAVFRLVNSG